MDKNYTKQITFCGCGGMYNYFLGIACILQEYGDNFNDTAFSGSSAGCFPALVLALNLPIRQLFEEWNIPLLNEVNKSYIGSLFRWNSIVRKHTMKYLPNNANEIVNGKLLLSLTRVSTWKNELFSEWTSVEDLLDCIMASSFLPIFDTKLTQKFRNKSYIDGSITNTSPIHKNITPNNTLIITTNMWRKTKTTWLWCYSDITWAKKLFEIGQKDAIVNLSKLLRPLNIQFLLKNESNEKNIKYVNKIV